MLVLSRKSGQELIIGDNVRITVNRISGNRVTLGISAPDEVRIVRGELKPILSSFEIGQPEEEEPEPEGPTSAAISAPWVQHEGALSDPMTRQPH